VTQTDAQKSALGAAINLSVKQFFRD